MVPVHLWLPEAHVEALGGSVILAGVLLKLGTYGFIRFSLPLFQKRLFFFAPLVYTIAAGIIHLFHSYSSD
jgi:NADH:ubiquinone oxidoreductase subunit 4 (subunit M)